MPITHLTGTRSPASAVSTSAEAEMNTIPMRGLDNAQSVVASPLMMRDGLIGLPPGNDNLEARLVALLRRLSERSGIVALDRYGRGRIELTIRGRFQIRHHGDGTNADLSLTSDATMGLDLGFLGQKTLVSAIELGYSQSLTMAQLRQILGLHAHSTPLHSRN